MIKMMVLPINQVIDRYVDGRHENGEMAIKRNVCFCYNIVTTRKERRITQQAYTLLMHYTYYTYNTEHEIDTANNAENAEAV